MTKQLKITIVIILLLLTLSLVFFIAKPEKQSPKEHAGVGIESITEVVAKERGRTGKSDDEYYVVVDKVIHHDNQWVFAVVTHIDEPVDSGQRIMAYAMKIKENKELELVAFTNHGFHDDDFPEGTPDHVIQRAEGI